MAEEYIFHYILDNEGNPVPEPDILKAAAWFEDSAEKRRVAWNFYGGEATQENHTIHISTAFLWANHDFNNTGKPVLWETMIFADNAMIARLREIGEMTGDRSTLAQFTGALDIQKRYTSKEDALQGHKTMCEFVETCIEKGLIQI